MSLMVQKKNCMSIETRKSEENYISRYLRVFRIGNKKRTVLQSLQKGVFFYIYTRLRYRTKQYFRKLSLSNRSGNTIRVFRECKCHARTNNSTDAAKSYPRRTPSCFSFDFVLGILFACNRRIKQNFISVIVSVRVLQQLGRK